MNIFVVDYDPVLAAQALHDKHIVRMPLEAAQLLCSVFPPGEAPYKRTHYNHPCGIWTRFSELNYSWLLENAKALCEEFEYRYGHEHGSQKVIRWCEKFRYRLHFPQVEMTEFARVMPEQYKQKDVVESYRAYYRGEKLVGKRGLQTWTRRYPPEWLHTGYTKH